MARITTYTNKNLDDIYRSRAEHGFFKLHKDRIESAIRARGADFYDMMLPETHTLPLIIRPYEVIEGLVYGRYKYDQIGAGPSISRGVLIATDQRIVLVNKKPLFVRCEEVSYFVVSGVTYSRAGFAGTVTLHTRMGNINVRTFNQACATNFVRAVETHIFNVHSVPDDSEPYHYNGAPPVTDNGRTN